MESSFPHQQKIERLETEKRQLEDRIKQLKHAVHTAERKRLTRAKIIVGSLVLRNHIELLRQLIAEASPQDGELLRSVFPYATKETHPHWFSLSREPLWKEHRQATGAFQERRSALTHHGSFPAMLVRFCHLRKGLATARRASVFLS
jgi:hypothetical protein